MSLVAWVGASTLDISSLDPPDRKLLGSRLLFRERVEAGYQLTPKVSLSVMLDPLSNAGLTAHNQGFTNVGARLGVTF